MPLPGEPTVADIFAQCPASTAKTAFIADITQLLADLDTAVSSATPPPTGRVTDAVRATLKGNILLFAQQLATAIET